MNLSNACHDIYLTKLTSEGRKMKPQIQSFTYIAMCIAALSSNYVIAQDEELDSSMEWQQNRLFEPTKSILKVSKQARL